MRLVAFEWMSLDGVVQAPGTADEDTSGGFAHGGWHLRYFDDTSRAWVVDNLHGAAAFLFGRRTYEAFAAHWPHAGEAEQVLAKPLNTTRKYVVSGTLTEPLAWHNSVLLPGDPVAAVTALRAEGDGDLCVIGSARLVQSLIAADLVDEFRLMIDPVVLGGGKRLFADDGVLRSLEVADSRMTSTGAMVITYRPVR